VLHYFCFFLALLTTLFTGTHLYVLYESYGFSVASLYCLGFFTGAVMSPITGPLVDKMGRRRAAMLYCALEIFINLLEQYPYLIGLVASRMIGGFTTNLLHSVFETWLDTEYRRRQFAKDKYEVIMRDSIIVSNLAAIVSGYLSHVLAARYGVVGPFRGAVACTAVALVVVATVWTENYGDDTSTSNNKQMDDNSDDDDESCTKDDSGNNSNEKRKGMLEFLVEAGDAFLADPRMLRVGIIQGLSSGALHIFIFLWAPMLIALSPNAPKGSWGLDSNGKPAFGLIFGAFMGAGVFGGLAAPPIRKLVSVLLSPRSATAENAVVETEIVGEGKVPVRPMAVEFLAACCYFVGAIMLLIPCMVSGEEAFSQVLTVFLIYEFSVGVFFPCEGVIRSLYFPETARASIMAFPAILVNVAVSFGVISTNFIRYVVLDATDVGSHLFRIHHLTSVSVSLSTNVYSLTAAFAAISFVMLLSAVLQLSLITMREWSSLFARAEQSSRYARSVSFSAYDSIRSSSSKAIRRLSDSVRGPTSRSSAVSSGVGEDLITLDALDQHLNHMSSLWKMKDE
jgi:MFS transporter, MFS domain-containing protein family, molybdate-anion transporter